MKFLFIVLLVSFSATAQMPKISAFTTGAKELTQKVMTACADDKSKIKGCESYTEFAPLKECLLKNKDALSQKCKDSLSLASKVP